MFVYCDSSIAFSAMSCSTYIFRDGLRNHTHVAMAHPSGVGIIINPCRKGYGSHSAFVHVSITTNIFDHNHAYTRGHAHSLLFESSAHIGQCLNSWRVTFQKHLTRAIQHV